MIDRPNNWDKVTAPTDMKKPGAGAYECKILKAEIEQEFKRWLEVYFDITIGEYAEYYKALWNSSTLPKEQKKWKGILRVWLPKNDGSENDEITKRNLKGFVTAVEESNPGYTWNWDENSLKNKEVGILYRDEEWEYNGRRGISARPFRALSITAVEDHKYTDPKVKYLKDSSSGSFPDTFEEMAADDGDLPF